MLWCAVSTVHRSASPLLDTVLPFIFTLVIVPVLLVNQLSFVSSLTLVGTDTVTAPVFPFTLVTEFRVWIAVFRLAGVIVLAVVQVPAVISAAVIAEYAVFVVLRVL